MPYHKGSKALVLDFLLQNIGVVLEAKDIQVASGGASEWARRLRELRNEDGWQVLSHKDRADLKPGQYLLETKKRVPAFKRGISKETKARVLERNGYTCQMCGAAAGDPDPFSAGRTVRLTMGHIIDKSKGGKTLRKIYGLFVRIAMKGSKILLCQSLAGYICLRRCAEGQLMISRHCWSGSFRSSALLQKRRVS